ncbi:MAG: DUF4321 domain-containing protein [Oscillospiraceae bacterium]|jgi:hypothetical protein|nr:DUF4321 domain-containing protein [Oscillospiraceae bacterium]
MKKGILKTLLLIVLLMLAVVLGKAAGNAAAGTKLLFWLGMSAKFGMPAVTIDLSVIRLTFGITIDINAAQALLLLASIFIYVHIMEFR